MAVNPTLTSSRRLNGWTIRHFDTSGVLEWPAVSYKIGSDRSTARNWCRARFSFEGVERIPADRACILVFSHRATDPTAIGLLVVVGPFRPVPRQEEVFDGPSWVASVACSVGFGLIVEPAATSRSTRQSKRSRSAARCDGPARDDPRPRLFDPKLTGR